MVGLGRCKGRARPSLDERLGLRPEYPEPGVRRMYQGFALRWMNGWAFGPNTGNLGYDECPRAAPFAG
jgi:hypothetical protein